MSMALAEPPAAPADAPSSLLDRLRGRDPDSWRYFVRVYAPLVTRWCRRCGVPADDAADVRQEVFRAVAAALGDFRRDRPGGSFHGWLRAVAHSKAADWHRRVAPGGRGAGGSDALDALRAAAAPDSSATPDEEADERLVVYRRAVEQVLAESAPNHRDVFLRVVVGGESPGGVAADLGLSLNAVYVAKSRLLRRVRAAFAALDG